MLLDEPTGLPVALMQARFLSSPFGLCYTTPVADFSFLSDFPLFLLQATQLTAIRTAAGSAVATNALAKKNAHVMVVFGTPSAKALRRRRARCTVSH
jgi:hypothetical protein